MLNNNSTPFTMPVVPCGSGYGMGNGGFADGGFWLVILLVLIFGWGNNGIGGYGRGGFGGSQVGDNYILASDMSQISKQISDTYNMTDRKFEGISNGICSLGYDQLAQMNGINTNILTTGNSLQAAIKDCCCTTQQNIKDTQYVISDKANMLDRSFSDGICQTNFNAERNTRSIVDSQNAGTQAILSKLNDMETARLREKLEAERDAKYALQGQLDRAQLRTDIVNDVRPCPKPAYITCNPFGCNCQQNLYGSTIA